MVALLAPGRGHNVGGRVKHFIVKSEPSTYSWATLVQERRTRWDGIRNAEARNNLLSMEVGDRAFFYHSGDGKEVVGLAEVVTKAYPDPTAQGDPRWVCVDLVPVRPLAKAVTLAQFRGDRILKETKLVTQGRLSVVVLTEAQAARVIQLGGG
jgi:predicted RNA-binding protein with PUA-like domain